MNANLVLLGIGIEILLLQQWHGIVSIWETGHEQDE